MAEKSNLPLSETGGVKPMNVEGRFWHERARLSGEFTDADRAWRKQWLKDQVLAHDEPRQVPELEASTKNIFRRIYQWPFDKLERALLPKLGEIGAYTARLSTSRFLAVYVGLLYLTYWEKYHSADWTKPLGLRVVTSRKDCLPCHEGYPKLPERTQPKHYNDEGFYKRKVLLDV